MNPIQLSNRLSNVAGNLSIIKMALKDAVRPTFVKYDVDRLIEDYQKFIVGLEDSKTYSLKRLDGLISSTFEFVSWIERVFEKISDVNENIKSPIDASLNNIRNNIVAVKSELLQEDSAARSIVNIDEILDEQINKLRSEILAVNEKAERLDESIQKSEVKLNAQQQEVEEGMTDFYARQREAVSNKLDELISFIEIKKEIIERSEKDLNKVISIMASKALGGGFMENAVKEEKAANRYRTYSIILMAVVGAFFLTNFVLLEMSKIDTNIWLARFVVGIFFSIVIGYLVRQSSVHRAQQFAYQQKAFDLNALTPYVANLPEDVQHKIKQQMAEKLFVSSGASPSHELSFPGIQELLIKLVDKMELPKTPR